jgi:hypothetical protein
MCIRQFLQERLYYCRHFDLVGISCCKLSTPMTARDSLVSRDARTALQTFIAILAPPKHLRELSDFLRNTQYNIMLMQNAQLSTWREHAFKRFQVCGYLCIQNACIHDGAIALHATRYFLAHGVMHAMMFDTRHSS